MRRWSRGSSRISADGRANHRRFWRRRLAATPSTNRPLPTASGFFRNDQFVRRGWLLAAADPRVARRPGRSSMLPTATTGRAGGRLLSRRQPLCGRNSRRYDRTVALAPDGRLAIDDGNLRIHTAEELKAELERDVGRRLGPEPDARLQGTEMTSAPRRSDRPAIAFLTVLLLGSVRVAETTVLARLRCSPWYSVCFSCASSCRERGAGLTSRSRKHVTDGLGFRVRRESPASATNTFATRNSA